MAEGTSQNVNAEYVNAKDGIGTAEKDLTAEG